MSNPYRARPSRPRVDATMPAYGMQNQNSWNTVPLHRQQSTDSSNAFQSQAPMSNQMKSAEDSWDWGVENGNNGNDSWNWSIDQQSESQQPQPIQQHQFAPPYTNQKQAAPRHNTENYVKNLNGNKQSSHVGQPQPPVIAAMNREAIPNHTDSYMQYPSYNYNRQFSMPPRPSSAKSSSGILDQRQWPNEQQQNVPYMQPPPLNQTHQTPPAPSTPANNYNWSNADQQSVPLHNWQNQSEATPGYWQDSTTGHQHVENIGNQWPQQPAHQSHQQSPQQSLSRAPNAYPPTPGSDHSKNWPYEQENTSVKNWLPQNQAPPNQWQNINSESIVSSQPKQSPPNCPPANNTGSWQQDDVNLAQHWQQMNMQSNVHTPHWKQPKLETGGSLDETTMHKSDWQQIHPPPSHFASSTTSTTSGSLANMSSSTEPLEERKRSLTPATSSTSLNEYPLQSLGTNQMAPENNVGYSNMESFHGQTNAELDWNAEGEWNTAGTAELANDFNNMSIQSKPLQDLENTHHAGHPQVPANDWNHSMQGAHSEIGAQSPADNIPGSLHEQVNDKESLRNNDNQVHDQLEHQLPSNASAETISQANYDQWYKQSVVRSQVNDRSRPPKQWPSEQTVENYENIQQPSEFVNLEVVAPELQERDMYGSHDSINKETLDNDPKQINSREAGPSRDFRQDGINVEVPTIQQVQPPLQAEQAPDNYEFASNDRNTFLETGELTDSHPEHEPALPSQDDENDEVPNDIPFLREVPGQSSTVDPRRNDPTGQEQYTQSVPRIADPRRNEPSGQENVMQGRNVPDRAERRDVPPGQERNNTSQRNDADTLERRNDPSGRERSLPPQQSRNDPSGEERMLPQTQSALESSVMREIPGRGTEAEESMLQPVDSGVRQIPGGRSPSEPVQVADDRTGARVVTGSQEVAAPIPLNAMQEQCNNNRNKREGAVGASMGENEAVSGQPNCRDSYEDGDDEGSGNSREESRERRRDASPKPRMARYEYNRKGQFYDRDRDYEDDFYYDRRRGGEYARAYMSREDLERREVSFRDDERRHPSRDDLDRHPREDLDGRPRMTDDVGDREGRRRPDDRRRERPDMRDYDSRYPRTREYPDRRRDEIRCMPRTPPRRYPDYDPREPYRREYPYDDPYGRNSRPSSRSSFNDRDQYYLGRQRDAYPYPYNGYPNYEFGLNYNSNYYAYLEDLRRNDPAAYAEWYHKYYQQQQQLARGVSSYTEDRASVHSGQSSCDDRITSDKRNLTDMSVIEDQSLVSSRMTPTKFSTAHVKGIFSIGAMVHVLASYPTDGERAKVDMLQMESLLMHDVTLRELKAYPGPLIKQVGVTHKKTIIEYCENKIKKAVVSDDMTDCASYILLYELMIMLIQQNGNVVGVDIAALLLRNKNAYPYDANKRRESVRRESTISQRSAASGGEGNLNESAPTHEKDDTVKTRKTVEQLTEEFRNTLLYGLVQEALEYAMAEGLWGHALFLASKLDKRTHASVMTRFANSLPPQDPLQTLYQLHSGRVPASVTCISDAKWDDWRPHLAMIISNTSANPEINRRSITILGDTLAARGDIHAAHFCYILSQVDFGSYGTNGVKLVLIGANHHKPYAEFVSMEAIMLTEIYEYARNLSEPGFSLVDLQTFKFNLAAKMVDYGLIEKALLYIEQIAVNIANEPSKYLRSFIKDVYVLGDRLKYHDPVCKDSAEDVSNLAWLNNLADIVGKCETGEIVQDAPYSQPADNSIMQDYSDPKQQPVQHQQPPAMQQQHQWSQPEYSEGPTSMMEMPTVETHGEWQPKSLPTNMPDAYNENVADPNQYQQSYVQEYWAQQNYNQQEYVAQEYSHSEWQNTGQQYGTEVTETDTSQHPNKWGYEPQPMISMSPSSPKQYDPLEELDAMEDPRPNSQKAAEPKKASEKQPEKKATNGGSSWFGGLFSKLALKPKNQMILPDDSNPSIIWDPVQKKWTNKEDDGDNSSAALAPPPKISEMGFRPQQGLDHSTIPQLNTTAPTDDSMCINSSNVIAGSSNMFKMSRGRNMRANYVDVMNPGGAKSNGPQVNVATPANSPSVPMATSSPQLFIPAPVNDPTAPVDFLTPMPMVNQPAADIAPQGGPMMYNPGDMKERIQNNAHRSRYPPR